MACGEDAAAPPPVPPPPPPLGPRPSRSRRTARISAEVRDQHGQTTGWWRPPTIRTATPSRMPSSIGHRATCRWIRLTASAWSWIPARRARAATHGRRPWRGRDSGNWMSLDAVRPCPQHAGAPAPSRRNIWAPPGFAAGFVVDDVTQTPRRPMLTTPNQRLPRQTPSAMLLALIAVSACESSNMAGVPDTPTGSNAAHAPLDISNIEPLVVGPPDSFFLAKAQASPGFAGFFLEDDRLQVRSKVQQLPTNLTLPSKPGGDPYGVDVRSADWSFVELAKWNRPFTTTVTRFRWGSMDIDERLNRLTATVADPRAVEHALTEAGVPRMSMFWHPSPPPSRPCPGREPRTRLQLPPLDCRPARTWKTRASRGWRR